MVKKIINKPHFFFFGLVPIFIVLGFFFKDKTLDINIYDTYFIVTYYHFFLFSAVFFAMLGLNYFSLHWAERPPRKRLTVTHILLQIISLLFLLTKDNWNWNGEDSYVGLQMMNNNSNIILLLSFLVFLLSIFVHLINFFSSLFLKRD